MQRYPTRSALIAVYPPSLLLSNSPLHERTAQIPAATNIHLVSIPTGYPRKPLLLFPSLPRYGPLETETETERVYLDDNTQWTTAEKLKQFESLRRLLPIASSVTNWLASPPPLYPLIFTLSSFISSILLFRSSRWMDGTRYHTRGSPRICKGDWVDETKLGLFSRSPHDSHKRK